MSAVEIRRGRESDLPMLSEIEASAAETFVRYGQPLADDDGTLTPAEHWVQFFEANLLWIADDPVAGPVGFLVAERQDGGLYVAEVDVVATHQRQGLGRRLMQTAIAQARGERLSGVTLTTFRNIPWNAPFYRQLGFREVNGAELSPHLGARLARETDSGLQDRCGMRLSL